MKSHGVVMVYAILLMEKSVIQMILLRLVGEMEDVMYHVILLLYKTLYVNLLRQEYKHLLLLKDIAKLELLLDLLLPLQDLQRTILGHVEILHLHQ
jgi:hypothetical protein